MPATPRIKWIDDIAYYGATENQKTQLDAFFADTVSIGTMVYGGIIPDRPLTQERLDMLRTVHDGMNDVRHLLCGLDHVLIPNDRFHFLDRKTFRKEVNKWASGKVAYGHVFILDDYQPTEILKIVSHEIVHAAAYQAIEVRASPEAREHGKRQSISAARDGWLIADPQKAMALPHFHGLNEGVTESFAYIMRSVITSRSTTLTEHEKKYLMYPAEYIEIRALLDRIVTTMITPSRDSNAIWRVIFTDYFTGTTTFLDMLDADFPLASLVLRGTGALPEEVALACDRLQFDDLAVAIRKNAP